jgi:hypothetical protein
VTDERVLDGIKLASDAHEAGELDALHGIKSMVEDLMQTIQTLIADIESRRQSDD